MKKYTLAATSNPNIKRVCDRSGDWLHYHLVKENVSLRAVSYILHQGYASPRLMEWAKSRSAEEIERKLKAAGDKGDVVHQALRQLLTSGKISRFDRVLAEDNKNWREMTDEEWDCVIAGGRFWNDHDAEALVLEETIADRDHGFAGTLDWIGILHKPCGNRYCACAPYIGKIGLWDHKTGGGIYPNYGAQLAAYTYAKTQETPNARIIEYTAIDQLGTSHASGYKLEFYDAAETERHWREFLAAKEIHNAVYKPFDLIQENVDIPETVVIAKPQKRTAPAKKQRVKKPRKRAGEKSRSKPKKQTNEN